MLKSLLLLCGVWLSLIFLFYLIFNQSKGNWSKRDTIIMASATQGAITALLLEGLSLFDALRTDILRIAWMAVFLIDLILIVAILYRRKWKLILDKPNLSWNRWPVIFIGFIIFQVVTLAMVAYLYPPNNYDSMVYHLARVMHWVQNQSVDTYATSIERQIQYQPFSEYLLANLHVLYSKDFYDNYSQWFAFITSIIGISSITEKLGGDKLRQIIAAVLSASIPMAIMQATSTQSDLITASLVISFLVFCLGLKKEPDKWRWRIGAGLSLGLAFLAKGTAYFFALPFAIWTGIELIKKIRLNAFIVGLVILIPVLVLNVGFFRRNYLLYGTLTGPRELLENSHFSIGVTASNAIRNTALEFSMNAENGFPGYLSGYVLNWLKMLHQFTGESDTDPGITMTKTDAFAGFDPDQVFNEDYGINPILGLLGIVSVILLVFNLKRNNWHDQLYLFAVCLILAFLLYCSYFKFQAWGNRLMLAIFLLWCPVIALSLFNRSDHPLVFLSILLIGLISLAWTFNNTIKPISLEAVYSSKSREENYFARRPEFYPIYEQVSDQIAASGCSKLGLRFFGDTWEYPLWVLLKSRGFSGTIEYVRVENPSSKYEIQNYDPCLILSVGHVKTYDRLYKSASIGNFVLYSK